MKCQQTKTAVVTLNNIINLIIVQIGVHKSDVPTVLNAYLFFVGYIFVFIIKTKI